ncbi:MULTISPECIES: SDH family Clp fold serine proteinase [Chryseobacterium]|uniref:Serine dehydrogenase proteinase n=1 Tax=Candidatus Chryseobacterium massiliense TaxID=204089 RepID=A0A3D9AP87_9FLAO|nr:MULTISPECIES: hypothetical protein [Chryseobacterium]REC43159.1 hypothetical protein DRF68_17095 [Candidatus Chryseobacterium massiliae]
MAKKQISEGEKIDAENIFASENKNEIQTFDVVKDLIDTYRLDGDENLKKDFLEKFKKFLLQIISKYNIKDKYNFVFLFDDSTMLKSDADKIYNSVTDFDKKKPVLMILFSSGGVPGSAYLIGKLCREYSNGIFNVAVPRKAKSAATLLCCAANEIHMGSLSELGPIDPQINGLPALGLKNSIEHISELVTQNPKSSDMFAKYLQLSIEPIQIGYYERVAESAIQYAENLLSTHSQNLPKSPNEIANELVYKYKDHGFVIDKSEAEKILGADIIKTNTEEYELSNEIYQFLDTLSRFSDYIKHNFYFIGGINSEPAIYKQNNS